MNDHLETLKQGNSPLGKINGVNALKNLILTVLLIIPFIGKSQHTFSIVAVDSITGEIGSAGATCGDSIIWPGTPGAMLISDIIPGIGAIHTQSYHNYTNQANAYTRMDLGDSPEEIIAYLVENDIAANPLIRQYGIVDYNGGSPRSAAYTGADCFNYKNHILGPNYAIQGNILLGQQILDSMESRFNNTDGCLSDKLMAAMQGAKVIGADTRCTSEGTSSLSAFLRVAKPTDDPDALFIDLNIAGTAEGVEPINELQTKYNNWKMNNPNDCSPVLSISETTTKNGTILVYPNPTDNLVNITLSDYHITNIVVTDIVGSNVFQRRISSSNGSAQISLSLLPDGIYFLTLYEDSAPIKTTKIILQKH